MAEIYQIGSGMMGEAMALDLAKSHKIHLADLKIVNVPGVFEIPVTISKNLKKFGLVSVSRTGAVAMTRGSEIFK